MVGGIAFMGINTSRPNDSLANYYKEKWIYWWNVQRVEKRNGRVDI